MHVFWEFERMQGDKKLVQSRNNCQICLQNIKPNLNIDTKNMYDWQIFAGALGKQSQGRKPCSLFWLVHRAPL